MRYLIILLVLLSTLSVNGQVTYTGATGQAIIQRGGYGADLLFLVPLDTNIAIFPTLRKNGRIAVKNGILYSYDSTQNKWLASGGGSSYSAGFGLILSGTTFLVDSSKVPTLSYLALTYYTQLQVNTLLAGKEDTGHTHTLQEVTDAGNTTTTDVYTHRQFTDTIRGKTVGGCYNCKELHVLGTSIALGSLLPDSTYRATYLAAKELGYLEVNHAISGQKLQGQATQLLAMVPTYDSSIHGALYIELGVPDANGHANTPGTWDTTGYSASADTLLPGINTKGWPASKLCIALQNYTTTPNYTASQKYVTCTRDIAIRYGVTYIDFFTPSLHVFGAGGLRDATHPYIQEHAWMGSKIAGTIDNAVHPDGQRLVISGKVEFDSLILRQIPYINSKLINVLVRDEHGNIGQLDVRDFVRTDSGRHMIMGKVDVGNMIDTNSTFTVNAGNAKFSPTPQLQSAVGFSAWNRQMLFVRSSWNSVNTGVKEWDYVARTSSTTEDDTAAVADGDTTSEHSIYTWNGTAFIKSAMMQFKANGTHTGSNSGSTFHLQTTINGTTTPRDMMFTDGAGRWFFNGTATNLYDGVAPAGLNVTSTSRRFNQFAEGTTNIWQIGNWNAGANNGINWDIARGTKASPTAIQATDAFKTEAFAGHDGSAFASGASWTFSAPATWSSSGFNHSISFDLKVTTPFTNTPVSKIAYTWANETLTISSNSASNTGRVSLEDSVFLPSIIPFVSGTKLYLVANGANSNQVLTQSGIPYADITGAPSALSLTTTGTSGAATYNSGTGVLNIPQYSAGGGGSSYSVNTITASTYTETATSGEVINLLDCTSNAIAIGLPTAVGNTAKITFKKIDNSANTPTVTPDGSETIDGEANQEILFQYTSFTIISDGINWYRIN